MKTRIFKRFLPILLTLIMLLSSVAPIFATPVIYAPDKEEPYYTVIYEDGVIKIKLDADKVYELLRDGELTGKEMENLIPERLLEKIEDDTPLTPYDVFLSLTEYLTVDDIEAIIKTLPLDVLVDYFDIKLLEEIVTIEELIAIIPVDEIGQYIEPSKMGHLVNSEVVAAMLTDKVRNEILTDEFIEELLSDEKLVNRIIADYSKHIANLIDGPIVDDVLSDPTIKSNLLGLAESNTALNKLLASPDDLTAIKNYMLQHPEKVSGFANDPQVIEKLYYSASIRAFLEDEVGAEMAIKLTNFNYNALVNSFSITEDSLRANMTNFGLTAEELDQYSTFEELVQHNAIELDKVCEYYGITVQRLFGEGIITYNDVAKLISDHWSEVLEYDGLLKSIISTVGLHEVFEHFDANEIVAALGGYYALIEKKYYSRDDVITAIGGYNALMDYLRKYPEKLEAVFTIVPFSSWARYGIVDKIIEEAGGYEGLISMYSVKELDNIIFYFGRHNFVNFLRDTGLEHDINFEGMLIDLIKLLKSKEDKYPEFSEKVFNRFTSMMAQEVTRVYLNKTNDPDENVIYKNGEFFVQQIAVTSLQALPTVDEFLAMESGDPFVQYIISTSMRGKDYNFGISLEFVGSLTRLQRLAEKHRDNFDYSVSDDLDITVDAVAPIVLSELYEKAILSDKLPDYIKKQLLLFPSHSLDSISAELAGLTDSELKNVSGDIEDKIEDIRKSVYKKIDKKFGEDSALVKIAKNRADDILEKFTDPEKLSTLRYNAIDAISIMDDKSRSQTLAEFYTSGGIFIIQKDFEIDLEKLLKKKITFTDDVLILFGNDLTVEGTLNATLKANNINRLSIIGKDGQENVFFLPESFPLEELNKYVDTGYTFEPGALMSDFDFELIHEEAYFLEFYDENGVLKARVPYSNLVLPDETTYPAVPDKSGYTGEWEDFTLYSDKTIKIYPVYTAVKYSVTINVNGTVITIPDVTVETKELPIPTPDDEDDGYDFDGWYVDVNGDGVIDPNDGDFKLIPDPDGDGYLVPDGETLPAGDFDVLSKYNTTDYTVKYYDKGTLYDAFAFTVESTVFPVPSVNPTPLSGYTFVGWFADLDNDGTGETPISNVDASVKKNISVYAKYDTIKYDVSFEINGTVTTIPNVTVATKELPIPTPEKDGYDFDGWYVDVNGDGVIDPNDGDFKLIPDPDGDGYLVPDGKTLPTEDFSIASKFTAKEYTVKYYDKNSVYDTFTFTVESTVFPVPSVNPSPLSGYTFAGWFADLDNDGIGETPISNVDASVKKSINVYAKYDTVKYDVSFEINGTVTTIPNVTVETKELPIPTPEKDGYNFDGWYVDVNGDGVIDPNNGDFKLIPDTDGDGYLVPDDKVLPADDFSIISKFNAIKYTVSFYANGNSVGSLNYTVDDKTALQNPPTVPAKPGYTGEWIIESQGQEIPYRNYQFTTGNVTVTAKYTFIPLEVYNVYFVVGTEIIKTVEYTEGDQTLSEIPKVPDKTGYTGKWQDYTLGGGDIYVYAKYTLINYTATFMADGNVIKSVSFTIEDDELSEIPTVPSKKGYEGKWGEYTLGAYDITINAEYTLIVYTATFMADGNVVARINFTINDSTINEPDVPEKEGYVGSWEAYELDAADIVINAVYSIPTPPDSGDSDSGSDSETDSGDDSETDSGSDSETDSDTEPSDPSTDTDTDTEDEEQTPPSDKNDRLNKILNWVFLILNWILLIIIIILCLIIVFLIVIIIILLTLLFFKKTKDEDDDDNDPEPPVPPLPEEEPQPTAEPEPEPIPEVIEIVESVTVEEAEELMTDEVAETVLEHVPGAGTGMKVIINVNDLNLAYNAGDVVDIDSLKAKNLISKKAGRIKILAEGTLTKPLTVYAEQFSVQAIKMITLTGGKAIQRK